MSDEDCRAAIFPERATEARSPGPDSDQADGPRGWVEDAGAREEEPAAENRNDNGGGGLSAAPGSPLPGDSITCQPEAGPTPLRGSLRPADNGAQNGFASDRPAPGPLPRTAAKKVPSRKLRSNPSLTSQGSKRSKSSSKSATSQIPSKAQDDCCVHCILACLFCEFLTLCNIVLDCATCGSCSSDESCFCCCCGSDECGDCDLPCDMDCGIIDACCESADCLEICMECCGLCFSS